jgi:hypothetical protein
MAEPVLVLAWLVLAHLTADFLLQTDWMVRAKSGHGRRAVAGLLSHGLIVAACLIPVGLAWGGPGWLFVLATAVLHVVIDRSKVLLTRRAALEALTAAAKGAAPTRVYGIHLLRNALVPIITRASTELPFLFTGSLLLESFFGIPGLGYEGVNALNSSDLSMLKALVLLGAILFIVINLVTDVAYAWVDPRVRVDRE